MRAIAPSVRCLEQRRCGDAVSCLGSRLRFLAALAAVLGTLALASEVRAHGAASARTGATTALSASDVVHAAAPHATRSPHATQTPAHSCAIEDDRSARPSSLVPPGTDGDPQPLDTTAVRPLALTTRPGPTAGSCDTIVFRQTGPTIAPLRAPPARA